MVVRRKKPSVHADRIYLGKIVKPHALQGEVKFKPFDCDLVLLEGIETIYIEDSEETLQVEHIRGTEKEPIIKFNKINDRNEAEAMAGAVLWVLRERLPQLDEGFVYESDILYCQVQTDSGEALGRVEEVIETGSYDVLVVRGSGKERMFPVHPDVVVKVDVKEQVIIVKPLDYADEQES